MLIGHRIKMNDEVLLSHIINDDVFVWSQNNFKINNDVLFSHRINDDVLFGHIIKSNDEVLSHRIRR